MISLFCELCHINAPSLQERDVVEWTKRHLSDAGLEVWEDDAAGKIGGNSNNLLARLRGNKPGAPTIFLSAHFDTVEPTEGLEMVEEDGVFRSASDTILGADDKAGMAPMIEAVLAAREDGLEHGDIYLLMSCAEEIGLKGAAAMELAEYNFDFGFVLDTGPPVGSYVNRTAYHDKLDVRIIGKPAHAGKDPEHGINAIHVAARAMSEMKIGRISPNTTSNVGIISGGTGVNVVAPEVTIRCEARSTVKAELEDQVRHMILRFEDAGSQFGAVVEIDHRRHYDAYVVEENSRVVQVGQRASRNLGLEPELRVTLGGSDANMFNKMGIPCIVVATGMKAIHTHDEHVSRADLMLTTQLCYELIRESALG